MHTGSVTIEHKGLALGTCILGFFRVRFVVFAEMESSSFATWT
jgi:hypothetical protein